MNIVMTKVYLVQYSDYLEQRILFAASSIAAAEVFIEKQKKEGYGWFEVIEVEVGKPFATRVVAKKFISGGKEIKHPEDLEDLFDDEGDFDFGEDPDDLGGEE